MNRKVYLEALRIAACFMVIVNHSTSGLFFNTSPGPTWFCSLTYFFICKTAVPLFLFIMGALLLGKEDTLQKTLKRLTRILVVLIIASFAYYVFYSRKNGTVFSLKQFLVNLPQNHITNSFWYLYLYLGLLCMLPILQTLVKALTRRQLEYLLFLSLGILGTVPLIPSFNLSGFFTAGLIGPYIGQVVLGYYIEKYIPMTKKVFWGCLCAFVLLIAFQVSATYSLYLQDPSSYLALDDRTLNTITASAACFFICVKYIFVKHPAPPRLAQGLSRLGALTFGIYLLSDMVLIQFSPCYRALRAHMHPMAAMVVWELLIFVVCALITACLRLIPPLRKWI